MSPFSNESNVAEVGKVKVLAKFVHFLLKNQPLWLNHKKSGYHGSEGEEVKMQDTVGTLSFCVPFARVCCLS